MDDIAYMVSIQPILVSLILFFVMVILAEIVVDFIVSLVVKNWHSPFGFKTKKSDSNQNRHVS